MKKRQVSMDGLAELLYVHVLKDFHKEPVHIMMFIGNNNNNDIIGLYKQGTPDRLYF